MNYIIIIIIFIIFIIIKNNNNDKLEVPKNNCNYNFKNIDWNSNKNIKNNNCYSYATDVKHNGDGKLQPGINSNFNGDFKYNCKNIKDRVKSDYDAYDVLCDGQCKCNYHKIFLTIDNEDDKNDYHFYKEISPNNWTHKPGKNMVTNRDSINRIITDPYKADKNYTTVFDLIYNDNKTLNYNLDCGCLCINN